MKHSKITSIFLALLILLTLTAMPATVSAAAESLLLDGSFEEWGTTGAQEAWMLHKNVSTGTGNVSVSDAYAHDGKYSAYVTDKIDAAENLNAGVRTVLYQELTGAPQNVALTFSAWVKVDAYSTLTEGEGGIRLIGRYPDVNGTVLGASSNITAVTDGWQKLSFSGTVTTTDPICLEIDIMANTANYEIYVDQFEIERPKPIIKEGGFEEGGAYWGFQSGASMENSVVSEDGNKYIHFTAHGQRILQTINNLVPGTTYQISFDIRSNHDVGYIDFGSSSTCKLWAKDTGDKWERNYFTWTQGEATSLGMRVFFHNGDKAAQEGSYVMYDNFVLEESDADELAINGSFEYGTGGLQGWSWNSVGFVSAASDAIDGKQSVKLTNTSGDNMLSTAAVVSIPAHTESVCYEYTAYVKKTEMGESSQIIMSSEVPGVTHEFFGATDLATGEWTKINKIVTLTADQTTCTLRIRLRGQGEVLIDGISFRELTKPSISFAKVNGACTDVLADGVKAKIMMPVTETGIIVLAVYSRNGNTTSIADVEVQAITATDVTNGHKNVTLSATSLEDFETVNYYAKLLILKNGTLVPYIDDILLTK